MKIALVVHDFLMGVGHGRYCIELARHLAGQHEIHVVANRFEEGLEFPFRAHEVKAWRGFALASVLTIPGRAERILRAENFDVVHAQGFSCWNADVVTAHVCNAARQRRAPASGLLKRVFPAVVIPLERAFYRRNRGAEIIAVSKRVAGELKEEYGAGECRVIYHGVDGRVFAPTEKGRVGGRWRWLFAGEAVKGLRQAIEALAKFPEADLAVVTRSEPGPWMELARDRGVAERVEFHGPSREMVGRYQAADLFLYPSEYDTFGMVVAEAMACGLPVVVGREIGAAEWIEEGRNGFTCDAGDLESVVRALEKVRDLDLEARRRVSGEARRTAEDHSWGACAERTLEVYQRAKANKLARR